MRERQRWQPEEDALLRTYVKQYGPKEWGMVSERVGRPLHRDPKSCQERWKNYLRPGLKKGSLSLEEQALVISLQSRYGNKWKAIAAHLPGRTPKLLGKRWEVFKEKQLKSTQNNAASTQHNPSNYDHILQIFAEKHVLHPPPATPPLPILPVLPNLSLSAATSIPSWMSSGAAASSSTLSCLSSSSATASPLVGLSLSPPEAHSMDKEAIGKLLLPVHQLPVLVELCRDVEEARQWWLQHRKEAGWRLRRLEQQLETEKSRKMREEVEEVEAKIQRLREEETSWIQSMEDEWRGKVAAVQRNAESQEAKMVEAWTVQHAKLAEQVQKKDGYGGAVSRLVQVLKEVG